MNEKSFLLKFLLFSKLTYLNSRKRKSKRDTPKKKSKKKIKLQESEDEDYIDTGLTLADDEEIALRMMNS